MDGDSAMRRYINTLRLLHKSVQKCGRECRGIGIDADVEPEVGVPSDEFGLADVLTACDNPERAASSLHH